MASQLRGNYFSQLFLLPRKREKEMKKERTKSSHVIYFCVKIGEKQSLKVFI